MLSFIIAAILDKNYFFTVFFSLSNNVLYIKKDLKEVLSNTKDKAKESLNVEVNLDEIKETTKVIKDKVKDLPSEALDTIQTKVIDKVQDAAADYAVGKVFKENFFKRLIESVINKLKKI